MFFLRIFAEEATPLEFDDAKDGFAEDTSAHLALAQYAVDEDDGYFLYIEAAHLGSKLHLYLEGIALELNLVELHSLQYLATIAHKSRSGVVYLHAGNDANILRCVV